MRLLAGIAALALVLGYLRHRFLRIAVEGESMRPALRPGDWVAVDRWAYRTHPPRPSDIVVAHDPREFERLLIKRVARVHADGSLDLLGDNAAESTDSRTFGPIPSYLVEGRVVARYWPRPSIASRRSTSASVGNASSGG